MSASFAHLHLHTDASVLDGLGVVQRMVDAAQSIGFKSLACTDHGTLANAITFSIACNKAGIKPIIGQEIYINHASKIGHLTIIANSKIGIANLIKLTNHVHKSSHTKRPSATINDLSRFSKGLICLTGCPAAPTNWLEEKDAIEFVGNLKAIFDGRVYAEIMFPGGSDTWSRPLLLARKLKLESVITNDVHFPYETDNIIHPILTTMKAAFTYNSTQLWLKSPEEIMAAASRRLDDDVIKKMMRTSCVIADAAEYIDFAKEPVLPSFSENDNIIFKRKILDNLKRHLPTVLAKERKTYVDRAMYEYSIIKKMGYATYFLILEDVINFAKAHNVRVGPGRGSGAASYILYLFGVTDIDPIEYALSFERFLNPHRVGYPDVDIDFDSVGRSRVLDYAMKKWGAIPIMTYAHYSHKTLVHDLAKTLKLPRDVEISAADKGVTSAEFKQLSKMDPRFKLAYEALYGQIRHRGKHAAGVVVTNSLIPIERVGDELLAAWTEGVHKELTYAGVVKFDFLGITSLSILKALEKKTGKKPAEPGEDKATFEIFTKGNLAGIFQFSGSKGIHDLTVAVQPETFMDLVAINALYRPGALDVGTAWKYPKWKKNPRLLHPEIDPILKETYGIIVFQEQLMEIFAKVSRGSLAEADLARQIVIKAKVGDPEWEAKLKKFKQEFISDGIKNAFGKRLTLQLWDEIITHARYSFNRSHAVCYTKLAWQMAWYKRHHPVYFYAEMMNWDKDNLQEYLFESVTNGIKIFPPNVNVSSSHSEVKNDTIYLPITMVKFLSDVGAKELAQAKKDGGSFKSFGDFAKRITRRGINSRARLGLYAIGGFDGLVGEPNEAGIDIHKIDEGSDHAKQSMYMGAVVPDEKLVALVNKYSESGKVAGIISSYKKKESSYGPYTVFYISPGGTFWIRNNSFDQGSLAVGDFVVAQINKNTGKAEGVELIKLED